MYVIQFQRTHTNYYHLALLGEGKKTKPKKNNEKLIWFLSFNDISTVAGYLIPKPSL